MGLIHRLVACLLWLGAATPAWAQSVTLHQSELWKTYTARTPQGQTICGVGTAFENGRQLYIKWFQGTDSLVVQIFKAGWAIPGDVEAPLVFRLDRSPSYTVRTTRLGRVADFLEFPIVREKVRVFTHDFTASNTMAIEFPGGNEPQWMVDLQGNAAAMDALVKCIQRVAGPNDTEQPYAYLRAAPPPPTTQPFAPAPFAAPGPAAQPQATQPVVTRPVPPPPVSAPAPAPAPAAAPPAPAPRARDPRAVEPEPFVTVPSTGIR